MGRVKELEMEIRNLVQGGKLFQAQELVVKMGASPEDARDYIRRLSAELAEERRKLKQALERERRIKT